MTLTKDTAAWSPCYRNNQTLATSNKNWLHRAVVTMTDGENIPPDTRRQR